MKNRRFLKKIRDNEKGATAVEFAVIAALLFIILFGILEFGFLFLQEHFIANSAREGVRIGVRANNYDAITIDTYNSAALNTTQCRSTTDRAYKVDCAVRDYLSTLYDRDEPKITVDSTTDPDTEEKILEVSVEAPNFFPAILSALIPGLELPDNIGYTATGEYEDSDE